MAKLKYLFRAMNFVFFLKTNFICHNHEIRISFTFNVLQIELDDSLPKYICTNCLESLRFALNFKRTCEASDKKFRKILNPTGNYLY